MNIEQITVFIVGLLLCHVVIWLMYVDYVGMLMKIFPFKKPRGFEEYVLLRNDEEHKNQVRKCKKTYSKLTIVYAVCFCGIVCVTKNSLLAFLAALGAYAFCIGIVSNKEKNTQDNT